MERIRDERGLTFIHPFDHPDTIAGQGTMGLEIVEDLPEVDVVVIGVGGGGMPCGVAAAVKGLRPGARVYGVEPRGSNALALGIAAGDAGPHPAGQRGRRPQRARSPALRRSTSAAASSTTSSCSTTPRSWPGCASPLERMKQVLEPAGAAALAAVLLGRVPVRDGERVCVVFSGGNVDVARLGELIAAAGPLPEA